MTGRSRWDASRIQDDWFRDHFGYAADEVQAWLGRHLDLSSSTLIDFGCGDGITSLGVALKSGCPRLVGVDITRAFAQLSSLADAQLGLDALPPSLEFQQVEPGSPLPLSSIDGLYSWSVFEHVSRDHLPSILSNVFQVLRPAGIAFIQIEPLYYSAFGSHLQRLLPEPWAHLRLSREELQARVMGFEGDLAAKDRDLAASAGVTPEFKRWLWGEYESLNRLTADELVESMQKAGFELLEEQRIQRPEPPPEDLVARYGAEVLETNEIRLIARKPR